MFYRTAEMFAMTTLIIVLILFATGIIHSGNPGPSPEEQAKLDHAVATATVRALQTYGSPRH